MKFMQHEGHLQLGGVVGGVEVGQADFLGWIAVSVGRLPSVVATERQPAAADLFAERGALDAPRFMGAGQGVGQILAVELELRPDQIEVAVAQHGPVNEALVLRGPCAPRAEVRIEPGRVALKAVDQVGIEREQSAVEARRPLAGGVAGELVAEELVVAPDPPALVGRSAATS